MVGAILVTGGAGYIGSHVVLTLLEAGYPVVVLDDLSTGRRAAVPKAARFVKGDVGDRALLSQILGQHAVTNVMHFAGAIVVPESVVDPLKYYLQNTGKSRNLIQACIEAAVSGFIFSSTAAVYGQGDGAPVSETAPAQPASPYGTSKLMTEWMLRDVARAHGLNTAVLRYFNVAGADPKGRSGQSTPGATHLIKVACETACGRRPSMKIFGTDYDTPDGTCIRDYIHVTDLADAHLACLQALENQGGQFLFNCGYGHGYSVKQVLEAVERVSGRKLKTRQAERRPGDVARIVADVSAIRRQLAWRPRCNDLDLIVKTALAWERKLVAESEQVVEEA
ncbi:UDP-glucose 4-epimerase GalE [Pelagibius litoralis]|uniref:UDP-glucose 4-epimerase n=1 Tax=Pelagibius litoralis TaxID=374515 RepID=A0A967EYB8_9PROT|nr:UDP-glucose 4-epimerase GalE [Pelagibius litoralis]NIA69670.1 UDP-glucose 4-epimerase GalE [Pelagibius litoralis]